MRFHICRARRFNLFMAALLFAGGLWTGWGASTAEADGGLIDNIIFVKMSTDGGSDDHDGTSWGDAFATLQKALNIAIAGDQIWIAAGTYYPTGNIADGDPRTAHFEMRYGASIYGGFAGYEASPDEREYDADIFRFVNETTLSGNLGDDAVDTDNAYHVFYHDHLELNATAILDGVTITGGNADGEGNHLYGGGMYNEVSSPALTNVIFQDNKAFNGGGIYNYDKSNPILTNVTISSNEADSDGVGGGMYNQKQSNPVLMNVTINSNTAGKGGGMFNQDLSSPTLTNVTISGNTADKGGGMYNDGSNLTMTNVTISGNTAGKGGGIYNYNDDFQFLNVTMTNVTISGNSASNSGGGMYDENEDYSFAEMTMTNVTISGNSASNFGGGIFSNSPGGDFVIRNSIIWGNSEDDITGSYTVSYSIVGGDEDPRFRNPDDGDFRLNPDSPAIDAGNNDYFDVGQSPDLYEVKTDLDGNNRFSGDAVDIGAYEYHKVLESSTMIAVSPEKAPADGVSYAKITLFVYDSNDEPNVGTPVTLTQDASKSSSIKPDSPGSNVTDATGQAAFKVTNTVAENVTYTAEADGVTITKTADVTFTIGDVDAAHSEVAANPTAVGADGSASSLITVTLKDAFDIPIQGQTVTLTQDASKSSKIKPDSPGSDVTDATGQATFKVTNTVAENVTYTAAANGITISHTADVTFTVGDVDATHSEIAANPTAVGADGTASSLITVTLKDAFDNPIQGQTVTLTQDASKSSNIEPDASGSDVTDASGQATFKVTNTVAENVTYTAAANGITISHTADVTFANAVISPLEIDISEGQSADYTVALFAQPDSDVTVTATSGPHLSLSLTELLFTKTNWNTPQQVTVTITDPASIIATTTETVTHAVYIGGALYPNLPATSIAVIIHYTDHEAPIWPDSSELTVSDITRTSVQLAWPEATDNIGASEYRIYVNGDEHETVGSSVYASTINSLTAGTRYTFQVTAWDAAGNESTPLSKQATTTRSSGGGGSILSHNADLEDLQIWVDDRNLQLSPSFTSETTDYTAHTEAEQLEITMKQAHAAAKVMLKDQIIADNVIIDLTEGDNVIVLTVQAENGTKKKYTLTITRDMPKPSEPIIELTDIAEHWAERNIKRAVEKGIVGGYPDGAFRPNNPVTRAEFIVMLASALKLGGTGAPTSFTDQAEIGAWAREAVARAVLAGIVNGYKDGRFLPNASITRAEMASMIARALQLPLDTTSQTAFADDKAIPHWAKGAVEALRKLGIFTGRGENRFVANGTATRAEAVVTLLGMLEYADQK